MTGRRAELHTIRAEKERTFLEEKRAVRWNEDTEARLREVDNATDVAILV